MLVDRIKSLRGRKPILSMIVACAENRHIKYCRQCGWRFDTPDPPERIHHKCPVWQPRQSRRSPLILKRIKNFTVAAISHELNGAPTCDQPEIDRRLAICQGCELFARDAENHDVGVCTHADCGCNMGRESRYLNKLAWADQACPLGKWEKTT